MNRSQSNKLFEEAKQYMPGGVSSPVRAFGSVGGSPLFIKKANGAYIWDEDGNKYIDYVGSWGPAILGHAHPEVLESVIQTAQNGLSFGAPTKLETQLAKMVIDAVDSVEMVRFVSSGTEACMSAIRLARGFTGRDKIIKFTGNYHGHGDMLLVKAGSGVATFGLPDSPGVPKGAVEHTLVSPYNDVNALKELFSANEGEVAAIIVEPIVGNSGFIRPTDKFIKAMRELTIEFGALLIFDEVMTGFRVAWGGYQQILGVRPDLTTFGKVIGGGMPLAAYGGRKDIMSMVAPAGPVYQAGTLSGNPLAVSCGIKTLELLSMGATYEKLDVMTKKISNGFEELSDRYNIPFTTDQEGGMFGFFFTGEKVNSFEEAQKMDVEMFKKFHRGMLERGIYLAPSPYEAGFVSLAHSDEDIDRTLESARQVMEILS